MRSHRGVNGIQALRFTATAAAIPDQLQAQKTEEPPLKISTKSVAIVRGEKKKFFIPDPETASQALTPANCRVITKRAPTAQSKPWR